MGATRAVAAAGEAQGARPPRRGGWQRRCEEYMPRLKQRREAEFYQRSLPRDLNDWAEQKRCAAQRDSALQEFAARGGRWAIQQTVAQRQQRLGRREDELRGKLLKDEDRERSAAFRMMRRQQDAVCTAMCHLGMRLYDVQWSEATRRLRTVRGEKRDFRELLAQYRESRRCAAEAAEAREAQRRLRNEQLYVDTVSALHRMLQEEAHPGRTSRPSSRGSPRSLLRSPLRRRRLSPSSPEVAISNWLAREAGHEGMPPLRPRPSSPASPPSPPSVPDFSRAAAPPRPATCSPRRARAARKTPPPEPTRAPLIKLVMNDFANSSRLPSVLRPLPLAPQAPGLSEPLDTSAHTLSQSAGGASPRAAPSSAAKSRSRGSLPGGAAVRRARSAARQGMAKGLGPLGFLSVMVRNSHAAAASRLGRVRARTVSTRPCSASSHKPGSRPPSATTHSGAAPSAPASRPGSGAPGGPQPPPAQQQQQAHAQSQQLHD